MMISEAITTGNVGARAVYDAGGLHMYDAAGVQRILFDANNAIQKVIDSAGVTRVELGNLAANGVSPAQYGLRANAADGSPIFDSLGLIAVMSQPAGSIHGTTLATSNSTTYEPIAGASLTFVVARQQTFLFIADTACNVIGGAPGNWGYVIFNLDGVNHNTDAAVGTFSQGTLVTNATIHYSTALAPGSHTIALYHRVDDPSVTIQNFSRDLFAFRLGG